jgi:hypothetical protein
MRLGIANLRIENAARYKTYSGRPKYGCAFTFFDVDHRHERNSITDEEIEAAVFVGLRKENDPKVEAEKSLEERKEGQWQKQAEAENRPAEMEISLDRLYEDQRELFETYKDGLTEKKTFLQQTITCRNRFARCWEIRNFGQFLRKYWISDCTEIKEIIAILIEIQSWFSTANIPTRTSVAC